MKDKIRIELYKHRRFAGSDWSYSKAFLAKLESIFESIVFSNPVLDYTYLFVSNVDDFPLLNPKVYDSDGENDYKQEVKEVEEYINSQMIIFKLNGYNLMNLIDLVEPSANYMLGRIIANVYCDGQFNRDLFEELLKHVNNFNIIYSYALEIYCTSEKNTLNEIIDAALELSASDNIIAILAKIEIYDINENPIIEKLSEQIKQVYWANFSRYFTHDKKTLVAVIERTLKYKNANAFIECLETAASFLTGDECISYLKKFIDEPDMKNLNTLSHYHLEKIFTRIYESFDKKYDRYSEIAYIELFFRGVLTWTKLKCFLYLLKNDPNYYAQMLDIVYVHEGDTKVETTAEKKKIASNLFKFYYDIKFCPCVDDDKDIRYDALLDWVNSFRELLVIQNQSKLFAMSLGRLFAHSPKGKDGYFPHESVRRIIEKMRDENIGKEYTIETFNKRGVYSPNAGISETKIADTYKENANAIRTGYPITAAIYDKMSADYYLEAARERRAAEDEF